jgi:hypothetical protein
MASSMMTDSCGLNNPPARDISALSIKIEVLQLNYIKAL